MFIGLSHLKIMTSYWFLRLLQAARFKALSIPSIIGPDEKFTFSSNISISTICLIATYLILNIFY